MISVIIPVKNAEKTIKESINSVINQNISDIEIICVINNCTDNSLQEIESIKDDRIKILNSSPGIVAALNKGLKFATGELIARQDADDIWAPQKLIKQLNFLKSHPDIDILGTQIKIINQNNEPIGSSNYPLECNEIINYMDQGINPIAHSSVIFKSKILEKCAGYWDIFLMTEDFDFWFRCSMWFRFANLEEELVFYKKWDNPKWDPRVPQVCTQWYKYLLSIYKD